MFTPARPLMVSVHYKSFGFSHVLAVSVARATVPVTAGLRLQTILGLRQQRLKQGQSLPSLPSTVKATRADHWALTRVTLLLTVLSAPQWASSLSL